MKVPQKKITQMRLKTGFECLTVIFIKRLSETFRDFTNQILIWLNLHLFPLELKSKRNYLRIFLAFFNSVKITQNVASLKFSAQNCRLTTVYKDVPSVHSVGPPAVAPSARNELQKITQMRLKTGFECMTVIFITKKNFQNISQKKQIKT